MKTSRVIQKQKNMNIVSDGTDDILDGLCPEDKIFCLAITSELSIIKPQTVTKKVVENLTSMYKCKTSEMLTYINKLIQYFYYNLPKGFKRVPGLPYILCNENDEIIHFLRRYCTIFINKQGYASISAYGAKRYHRIIALTWIPNPENKETVNHIDGVKLNNKVSNLEWNTFEENRLHAVRTGLYNTEAVRTLGNGEKNSQAILSVKDVIAIRKTVTDELSKTITYLGKTFNLDLETINDILHFRNKKIITPQYKTRTFESKMFPGKMITVKRRLYKCDESFIRGYFIKVRRKLVKNLSKRYKMSSPTINDIISRRSWNYDYC